MKRIFDAAPEHGLLALPVALLLLPMAYRNLSEPPPPPPPAPHVYFEPEEKFPLASTPAPLQSRAHGLSRQSKAGIRD